MSLRKHESALPKSAIAEDVIVFHVGEMRLAIAARDVDEIRNMEGLTPHDFGPDPRIAKVKAILTRKKGLTEQTFFVVTSATHFGVTAAEPSRLLVLRDHPVALLADAIDRMMQVSVVHALPQAFNGIERLWYRGLAVMDGKVVPMVEPASFLSREELAHLAATKVAAVSA